MPKDEVSILDGALHWVLTVGRRRAEPVRPAGVQLPRRPGEQPVAGGRS